MTSTPETSRPVFWWLIIIALMTCAMILVGGATRLTDSGLSITEWRPVSGALPPMSDAAWEAELERYRQIPQYQEINRGMSMAEFQFIYWWEWGHRQLGRLIGLAFAIPLAFFWVTGRLTRRLKPRLIALLLLGGLQGAIGWWMVASGLTDRVSVSHYRLATHLGLAFVILGVCLWLAMEARYGPPKTKASPVLTWTLAFWALIFLQVILGALVAGLNAGSVFTTWPGFEGRLFPAEYLAGMPWHEAIFESRAAVQFHHRWTGYAVAAAGLALAWRLRRCGPELKPFATALPMTVVAQTALGIVTLIHAAPLSLSLVHQGGAVLLFVIAGLAASTARRA